MPLQGLRWTVAKNTFYQLILQGVSLVTGILLNMVLSRSLGVEGFGMYNYVFSFYAFFLAFNDFGVNMILIREVSRNREKAGAIIGPVLLFKLAVSFLGMITAWCIIAASPVDPALKKNLYLYAWILPILVLQLPLLIFQVDLNMKSPMVLGILNRLFQFALVMMVILNSGGIVWIVAALLAADAVFIPVYWRMTRPHLKLTLQFDFKIIGGIFKSSIPLGIAGIVGLFVNQANTLFLERLSNFHEVGIYAAAFRITSPFLMLPPLVMNTVFPLMSRYAAGDKVRLRRLYKECLLYFSAAGFLIGIMVAFFSPWLTHLVFGRDFASAAPVLSVMMISIAAVYFGITSGNFLISIGKEKANIFILGAGGITNTILVIWLSPMWGALGAAIAMAGSFAVIVSSGLILAEYYFYKLRNQPNAA